MISVVSFLAKPIARYIYIPVLSAVIISIVKYASRNDKNAVFNREFFYWGPDICVTVLLALLMDYGGTIGHIYSIQNAERIGTAYLVAIILDVIVMSMLCLLIRKKGWEKIKIYGERHHMLYGIIIPDIIACLLSWLVYYIIINK